jgi:uncharacterized protein YeaO (DUF488 family)
MFKLKRAYEPPAEEDGLRVLVDRRWPCGVFKRDAQIDLWLKEIAPSDALTTWFGRDPSRWEAFRQQYWQELAQKSALVRELRRRGRQGVVTLVYRARDTRHNSALALQEYLERRG